jgi:cellulose synthase (UDP-forming)
MVTDMRLPLTTRLLIVVASLAGLSLLFAFVTAPVTSLDQVWIATGSILAFLLLNTIKGRRMSVLLAVISVAVTARYLTWRLLDTLEYEGFWQSFFMTGLVLAEVYAGIALLLGYFQTLWPLPRRPVPMPRDTSDWPTVDIYIPTYNESLDVVKPTVLAALALDWPRDKLAVYILDDGRRMEFRDFARAVGAGYVIRPDNKGAKAGNINHATRLTDGEFIAIFDCDHVPTRAFLQFSMGWMLRDPKLAMMQTPHHFYSPDPFERNLSGGLDVPNEGLMFYGSVQPGNDLWNATFFCGSCAVIRRAALLDAGGVPTETVTEDCHLSLRMQRRGWSTAYLRMPLAAGLATERLIMHIGQRMRWARGMLQIFRVENPLFASGLSLPQRLCYFSAMFHFGFALPRVVFLTSPLAFLLLGHSVIAASPLAIVAYAGPHVVHAIATASRISGSVRHSFWSEIYEVVLALWLLPLTIVTLLNPRKGKFNVTDKGGVLEEGYYDWHAVWPSVILCVLLMLGVASGVRGLWINPTDSLEFQAYALNGAWALLCLVPVLAGIAVGRERRQRRSRARVSSAIPAALVLPNGERWTGVTRDLSLGGLAIILDEAPGLPPMTPLRVELDAGSEWVSVPAMLLDADGHEGHLRFEPASLADEALIVNAVMGRADTWIEWDTHRHDKPLRSLIEVVRSVGAVFTGVNIRALRGRPVQQRRQTIIQPGRLPNRTEVIRPRAPVIGLLAALLAAGTAHAQTSPPRPEPRQTQGQARPQPAPPPARLQLPPNPLAGGLLPEAEVPLPPAPEAPAAPLPPPVAAEPPVPPPGSTRQATFTLRQSGLRNPMQLRGTSDLQGVVFGTRADEVVTAARLVVSGATSPALIPELSQIVVTLNDQFVGVVQPQRNRPAFGPTEFALNPLAFADVNRLNFRFTGRYAQECNDPLSGLLWATVSDLSAIHLTFARLPIPPDLSRLPEPFFDPRQLRSALVLPFVVQEASPPDLLRAAGIAASWFAVQAGYRGASFPVAAGAPPTGHGVVVATSQTGVPGLDLPRFSGPTLALVPNPNDAEGQLLVIGGRTPAEAARAATALAVGQAALTGTIVEVEAAEPAARQPYDAPRWLRADRPVRFGELVDPTDLQAYGYAPGNIVVPLRTAPDLYSGRSGQVPVAIRYRSPPVSLLDLSASRLDVAVSDSYVRGVTLRDQDFVWPLNVALNWIGIQPRAAQANVGVPSYLISGDNELQLRFDMRPLSRGDCVAVPGDIRASIDPESTIDISGAHRFTQLPNLGFFVAAGFPFTRMADLSETAMVLPDRPTSAEIAAFLSVTGRMAALVGLPATGFAVVRPGQVQGVRDKDLLVIGALNRQPAIATLLGEGPIRMEGNRLSVAMPDMLGQFRQLFLPASRRGQRNRASTLLAASPEQVGTLIGVEHPGAPGRSVVILSGATPGGVEAMAAAMRNHALSGRIQGDLALLNDNHVESFQAGDTFTIGALPFWLWPQYFMAGRWELLLLAVLGAALLLTPPIHGALRRRTARRLRGGQS